ncbi:hypothetical protein TMatcc_001597 [Talaromyces marneffei ATCC 18224]|uniref:Uncharacterized protein n=1 Tax=Talaromyces marneffei (strain ATCC 18224 / CBS 334.59 / QM 7333) TaxID=441960 RepID=B6QH97_TALMQ|nr:conserved hypothetical protein [Talaromyces marneffei ATCC 18224]
MDNFHHLDQSFDFGSFINFPEDNNMESNNMDFQFPTEDISADLSLSDMQLLPDMDFSQYDASVNSLDTFEYSASSVNESPLAANYESFTPQAEDFRFLVDSWASTDQRSRSMKQKRRDATIDLHLQRFMNTHSDSQLFPTDSEFSFSDSHSLSYSHESSQQSPVASTPASSASNSDRSTVPQIGGRELVFDINLNTATNLPKKQKKRTRAQIEDYVNARRNGVCLKHKKQHKKCNCHVKQSEKTVMDAKRKRRAALPKVAMTAPELAATSLSETPSTVSRSSFSPSVFSQVDSQSFNEEIDSALASLDDLNDMEPWASLVSHTSMADTTQQQFYQSESYGWSPVRYRNINTPEVSTNLQTNVEYLPERDESFNQLLGLRDGVSDHGLRNSGGLLTTGGLSGLPKRISGPRPNISSGQSGVLISSQIGLPNAQGQVSTPTLQMLPTTSSLVPPVASLRLPGGTSTPMQNISPVRPSTPESSTMVLANAQQQPSTPAPHVLPTTSSLVPPVASQGLSVRPGLPLETVVPVSNFGRQTVPTSTLSPLPSMAAPVQSRLLDIAPSPVATVLPAPQLTAAQSLAVLSSILAPGLQAVLSELQASTHAGAMFKDIPKAAYLAVGQFYGISTAVLSAVYWISELCVMALQGMQQVAMPSQSNLYNFAEQFRQRKPVTNTCASVLSTSLSLDCPMALQV